MSLHRLFIPFSSQNGTPKRENPVGAKAGSKTVHSLIRAPNPTSPQNGTPPRTIAFPVLIVQIPASKSVCLSSLTISVQHRCNIDSAAVVSFAHRALSSFCFICPWLLVSGSSVIIREPHHLSPPSFNVAVDCHIVCLVLPLLSACPGCSLSRLPSFLADYQLTR